MNCRCGKEITHVPERLAGLANWVCRDCATVKQEHNYIKTHDEDELNQIIEDLEKAA